MATDISIETDELNKLLELLKEYTGKLRSICEEKANDSFRVAQMAAFAASLVAVAATIGFAFVSLRETISSYTLPIAVAGAGLAMAASWVYLLVGFSRRFRRSYDAKQVSATVERLIKTASQYSEHATRRISDKFEFDLRLAEAEAALQMYQLVFNSEVKAPMELRIISATYGMGEHLVDVTNTIADRVSAGTLKIPAGNELGGDPIYGSAKVLTIVYSYKGQRRIKVTREGEVASLP